MIPGSTTDQSDLSIAVVAAQAAFRAAELARDEPLRPRAKSVSADLVTDADGKAETAAARSPQRPTARTTRSSARRAPTTAAGVTAAGSSTASTAPSPSRTGSRAGAARSSSEDQATAVYDGHELYTAARGHGAHANGRRLAVRSGRTLAEAHVATFFRQDRLVLPGVRANARRILDETGLLRHAGPGTLELAWVAAGRLDAWIQPATDPWDWLPGALLVTEAGGVATTVERGVRWYVAGSSAVVDELVALLT